MRDFKFVLTIIKDVKNISKLYAQNNTINKNVLKLVMALTNTSIL